MCKSQGMLEIFRESVAFCDSRLKQNNPMKISVLPIDRQPPNAITAWSFVPIWENVKSIPQSFPQPSGVPSDHNHRGRGSQWKGRGLGESVIKALPSHRPYVQAFGSEIAALASGAEAQNTQLVA
jgi:hypothetical protein